MIDPSNITNYYRNRVQLEEFLLFTIIVAGKRATVQAQKLEEFLKPGIWPFSFIRCLVKDGGLRRHLEHCGIGQYDRIEKSFTAVAHADINLRTVGWVSLATFHGIGLKTAKFFLLHSRPGERHAVLDTHVLRELRRLYPRRRVPESTPGKPEEYFRLEKLWLDHLEKKGCTDYAAADLAVWNAAQPNLPAACPST